MAYKRDTCFICNEEKAVQDHHVIPVEYGGPKDGPQIKLCPSCHLISHYEAELLFKTGEYGQLAISYTGKAFARADKVVTTIVKARLHFEALGKPAQDARRRVVLGFSHEELLLVHAAKRVKKFKSLERFIKSCVLVALTDMRRRGEL